MSELDEFKATYFDECSELLTDLEEQFTAIEAGERDADRLNAVFRAIHSIKGGAGAFGFTHLVEFSHEFETLLDHVRDGRVALSDEVVTLCIRSVDLVADFVAAARDGVAPDPGHGAEEKARFVTLCRGENGDEEDGEPVEEFDIEFTPVMVNFEAGAEPPEDEEDDSFEAAPFDGEKLGLAVRFAPHPELYARANDPLLLFRELAGLGQMQVNPDYFDIPALSDFEPFGVYCAWDIVLNSDEADEEAVREVFEFVDGDCDLSVEAVAQTVIADGQGDAPTPEDTAEVAGVAQDDADVLDFASLAAELAPPPPPPPALKPAPREKPAAPASSPDANMAGNTNRRPATVQSIRVDLDKVDRVVNMVGELVITQSMLTQQMDEHLRSKYQELMRGLEVLAQTTRGLQDSVMAIRAQPVKSVFSRMPRLVRELATKTGKKIKLEMIGENTEIDKTVVEQLSDPLTHMIRNSADHGIEGPDKRAAAGKPETGTVTLSAEQAGGNILIIVEDDGAGINREVVLALARERGVVGADQQLSDEQIDNLIFAPGFSTVTEVSDISGRGVGMDVVLSNIKKIGGSVQVRSVPGKGTRMTLRLPLTLAVLDVMLVRVAGSPYVVPLGSIVETIRCTRADFGELPGGGRIMNVRGDYVPVTDLATRFTLPGGDEAGERFVVLCEGEGSSRLALIVDEIIGQQQVVIKSLEENFERIEGIAGGTILGDGSVALIVDVAGLQTVNSHKTAA